MQFRWLVPFAAIFAAACATSPDTTSAVPPASCPLREVAELPVTLLRGQEPVVAASIAGQTVQMLLDSGSADSFLTPAAYDRLNLVGTHFVSGSGTGLGGQMQFNRVIMQDVAFGQLTVKDDVLILADYGTPMRAGKPLTDGLIGEDVLRRFDIGLDLPDGEVTLFLPRGCTPNVTPWPGSYAAIGFTRANNNAPLVPYEVNGQTLEMMLDTGAYRTFVEQNALDRLGLKPEAVATQPGFVVGLGRLGLRTKFEQFGNVTIGAERFDDSWLDVADSSMADQSDGLLGEDYLAHHKVFIANSTDTAYFGLTQ